MIPGGGDFPEIYLGRSSMYATELLEAFSNVVKDVRIWALCVTLSQVIAIAIVFHR
jgi:hypothetical protein